MAAVFFTCGGAEANESAFKTARFYWKAKGKPDKVKVIARQNAYHGVTLQAMSATGMAPYWKMFEPRVPGFLHIQAPYPYRFQGREAGGDGGAGGGPGAGGGDRAGGRRTRSPRSSPSRSSAAAASSCPPDDYFPRVREICTKHDVLFIADEVITGFCRTGQWFALTHWNVQPDIQSFAKAVTSGYAPLGGIVVSRDIFETMNTVKPEDRWMHAYTYSGHPDVLRGRAREPRRSWSASGSGSARPGWARASTRGSSSSRRSSRPSATSAGGKGLHRGGRARRRTGRRRRGSRRTRRWACGSAATWRSAGSRPGSGAIPVPDGSVAEQIFFSPPLVITEQQIDRVLEIVRASIKAIVPA